MNPTLVNLLDSAPEAIPAVLGELEWVKARSPARGVDILCQPREAPDTNSRTRRHRGAKRPRRLRLLQKCTPIAHGVRDASTQRFENASDRRKPHFALCERRLPHRLRRQHLARAGFQSRARRPMEHR